MDRLRKLTFSLFGMLVLSCGGGPAPLSPITVTGKVTNASGPVNGAKVVINRLPAVTTAADGLFTVSNVFPPYDALVGDPTANRAYYYVGLRRTDPVLGAAQSYTATVSGTITGGGIYPMPAGTVSAVGFGSAEYDVPLSVSFTIPSNSGAFAMPSGIFKSVTWRGSTNISGMLHGLRWDVNSSGLPQTFTGHGSVLLSVADGGTYSGVTIALSPISAAAVSGTVAVPPGYTLNSRWVETYFPGNARIPLGIEAASPLPITFSYQVPAGDNATTTIWTNASNGKAFTQTRKCAIVPGSSNVAVNMAQAPGLIGPADGSTNIGAQAPLSWHTFPNGGLHSVTILKDSQPDDDPAFLSIFTTGASASLPDLTLVGLSWPSATVHKWRVLAFEPITVDGWADPTVQTGCSFTTAGSAWQTFTTPP